MFKLKKVCKQVYLIEFDDQFDMSIHFLRVSEFVESDGKLFSNGSFEIIDYIDWYSHNMGDKDSSKFSYPGDWGGFNVPSESLKILYENNPPKDWNRCDHFMFGLYKYLRCKEQGDDFYLIATTTGDKETFEHEFAHALWEIDKNYKIEMLSIINNLTSKTKEKIAHVLTNKLGYRSESHLTEIQAYFSTGLSEEFPSSFKKYQKYFIEVYQKYRKLYLTN